MLWTFKRHYNKLKFGHKAILAGVFIVGSMVSLFSSLFAYTLPFQNDLPNMFSSMNFDTGNFSDVHFNQWGNNFAGIIFWLGQENLTTPEIVNISWDTQYISCSGRLQGIYYNNMRGRRLRPLDPTSQAILSGQWSGYETMTMTGGFYTNCTWHIWVYIPASNDIYGYIEHTRSGVTMRMVAGVRYDFPNNTMISGTSLSGTLITTWGSFSGWMWDNYGGIAQISSGQAPLEAAGMCSWFVASTGTILSGNDLTFTCSGGSITWHTLTGFILHIFSWFTTVYTSAVYTSVNSVSWTTGAALPAGSYNAMCVILQNQWVGPQCPPNTPFTVTTPTPIVGSGCSANFQWDITPANIYHFGGVMYYTNTSGTVIQISATDPIVYSVTWNFISPPITGTYTWSAFSNPINKSIYLTQMNARNYISSTYTTGSCTYTWATKQIYRDTIPPTTPLLSTPASGTVLCSTWSTQFSWSASTDTGGLSGYRYIIEQVSGTTYSGLVASGTTGLTLLTQNMVLGNYTRNIQAIDMVGNVVWSAPGHFSISPTACSQWTYGTGIQIIGSLSSIINADLDTVYSSEIFYIRWLTGSTLISVAPGTLIVNGTGIWTTGMITSTTPLRIELVSSDQYDDTVTSHISVAWITWTFNVTTKANACNLTRTQKLTISRVYGLIKDQYDGNSTLLNDFMATFQSILGDEVDVSEDCSLEYLLELINNDYDNADVDTSNHIAPNCKEYQISYNNSEEAYYSPMMKNRYYFINRETLIRHIDFYNAGDCHINTYGNVSWSDNRNTESIHVAPNGKIYHIQSAGDGFTSSDFVGNKYFDALSTITSYIDSKNPATNVWIHTVDRTFAPITYLAPNSKEYRIYKTSKWFMSYKLMKVIYFNTLAELESYINRNNPVKR